MDYNNISRRGLIKLNGDFDEANDGKLQEFLNGKGEGSYEEVKRYERVFEKLQGSIDTAKAVSDTVSTMAVERAEKIIDKITSSVLDEVDRIQEIFDEKKDDQAYPDNVD